MIGTRPVKKLTLSFVLSLSVVVVCSLCYLAQAGPEPVMSKDKEVVAPAPPPCEYFRAREWDLSVWGTFVFSADQGRNNVPNDDPFTPDLDPETVVGTLANSTVREPQNLNPN